MAMCPLLREECIREQCAWWFEAKSAEYSNCVVALLPERIDDISYDVNDIGKDVNGIKDNIANGLNEIGKDVNDIKDNIANGVTVFT